MRRGNSTGVSRPGVLDSGCRVADRAQAERERVLFRTSTIRAAGAAPLPPRRLALQSCEPLSATGELFGLAINIAQDLR